MWSSRPYTFDRVVRIFFTLCVIGAAIYVLYLLRAVLLPFFVGCLIAYMIEPAVKWNQRVLKLKSHTWAVVITTFEALLCFGVLCLIFIPIIEREFSQLSMMLTRYFQQSDPAISRIPLAFHEFIHSHFDLDKIIEQLEQIRISAISESIWKSVAGGLDKILGLLGWLICVVYVLFILLDFDKYEQGISNLIPVKYKSAVGSVMHDLSWTMKRYFRNQALISFITGLCYMAGFSIVGIPMSVVIGFLCMILFMVPYMVYLSVIPVTLMCIFKSMETGTDFWIIWLECIAVYVFVEAFSDMVLTPKIMGKALGLNPAIIILSLSVWGSLLGILGMVIALPASTILIKWGNMWLTSWRNKVNASTASPPIQPPAQNISSPVSTLDTAPQK